MARGPRRWDEATIERLTLEGRGRGIGANYKPWMQVFDFSSLGFRRRVPGIKIAREHHLFSQGEYHLFLFLEWARNVLDIREQFPLPRDLTREIALSLGIRHPCYPGTHVPIVVTVDFLVTMLINGAERLVVFDVKTEGEMEREESIVKLEIARAFCEGTASAHHLVITERIPTTRRKNLDWIRGAQIKDGEIEPYEGQLNELATRMAGDLSRYARTESLSEYCSNFDARFGLDAGLGLRVARLLLQSHALMADLDCPDLSAAPLSAFKMSAMPGQLHLVKGA